MTHVHVGGYQYWRIVNKNARGSPFHIYRVHFLYYAANEHRPSSPKWLDTANVPVEGSLDLIMDFTDPITRGVSLFHCHLLSHEDKGMMAKIPLRGCLVRCCAWATFAVTSAAATVGASPECFFGTEVEGSDSFLLFVR